MQHKCITWRNLQGDPALSIYLTCSQHIVHSMTGENSRPNPHGYKRQPTFQQDDMNRQEESKLYGVFIDQSRKYRNTEILAMKVLFKIMYFFKIFVLPRPNQDPRTTLKKKLGDTKAALTPSRFCSARPQCPRSKAPRSRCGS